jgi:hypothetical protein
MVKPAFRIFMIVQNPGFSGRAISNDALAIAQTPEQNGQYAEFCREDSLS